MDFLKYVELFENIGNFGILIIIAGVFLWDHISYKKKREKSIEKEAILLREISNTNNNISKSIDVLQKNLNKQQDFLENLDKNCIKKNNDVNSDNRESKIKK